MNKFVVVVFDTEAKAYEGVRAIEALHGEGSVTVYGTTVVQRDEKGKLSVKQRSGDGALGVSLGALTGALIGMFGGPVGAAIGLATGGTIGGVGDIRRAEVSDEFLETVGKDLKPGKFAVIAEASEDWMAPIDTRMEALGGRVLRESRDVFVDDMLAKQADSRRAEFAQWKAERAGAKVERMESALTAEIGKAQQKLQRSADQARERIDSSKKELEAKLSALQQQATKAKPEVKAKIDQRIADLRKEFDEREKKLKRAVEMAQEALQA